MPLRTEPTAQTDPRARYYASMTAPSLIKSIRPVAQFIVQAAHIMGVPTASDPLFEAAIVEALNNAVKYGNSTRVFATIVCELELVSQQLTVRILDQGSGFILSRTHEPDWTNGSVASIPDSGFGIPIIRSVFPAVRTITRPGEFGLEMSLKF